MMKTPPLVTTVVTVTLMGSALCHAQDAADKKQKQFEKLDADQNGSLSVEEYLSIVNTPERAEHFKRLDADENGSLTLEEFSTPPGKNGR
jgi:Ca2+-binding EF-hand superfamily protein